MAASEDDTRDVYVGNLSLWKRNDCSDLLNVFGDNVLSNVKVVMVERLKSLWIEQINEAFLSCIYIYGGRVCVFVGV